jgi:hypothetical protein
VLGEVRGNDSTERHAEDHESREPDAARVHTQACRQEDERSSDHRPNPS